MKTKSIALGAASTALALVLLYMASVIPSGTLALLAVSALPTALLVVVCGKRTAACQYVAAALLALMLLPDKSSAIMYALFFGHYSIVKSLIEGLDRLWLEWLLKLLTFFLSAAAIYAIWRFVLRAEFGLPLPLLFGGGAAAFVVYDIAYTGLIFYILKRLRIKQ